MDFNVILDIANCDLFADSWTVNLTKKNDCGTIVAVVKIQYLEFSKVKFEVEVDEEILLESPALTTVQWIAPYMDAVSEAITTYINTEE